MMYFLIKSQITNPSRTKNVNHLHKLKINNSGKSGILQIEFQADSLGKTVIKKLYSRNPLYAQKELYCDDKDPNLAYLYIMSTCGGILQGDEHKINIDMKKDSKAHVTTQGATRIYSMNSGDASQIINVTLHENSYLEFIPDQIIPHKDSRFYQKVLLNVHNDATMIYSEIVSSGRAAMGESFAYDICHLTTKATNQYGKYRFLDIANMNPKKQNLSSFGILGKYQIVGTVYILAEKKYVFDLYEKINIVISSNECVFGGVTIIKDDSGLLVRILGNQTEQIKEIIFSIVSLLRKTIIGKTLSNIRKA